MVESEMEDVRVITDQLMFPEGPVALADGSVLVCEIARSTLSRVSSDGRVTVVAHCGGGPNGAAIGPDAAVYICNNGGMSRESRMPACIQRVDLATGACDVLYTECEGAPLLAPNDLVFDDAGGMWFTDSGFANRTERKFGAVYYATPDGSAIRRVVARVPESNGIGLSPAGDVLYWAETGPRRVMRRRIVSPGELDPSPGIEIRTLVLHGQFDHDVLLVGLPGHQELDSLAVEADGSVCVATLVDGCVTVISANGEPVARMTLPAEVSDPLVTNICFGGADLRTAYLTLSMTGRLVSCRWPRPGLRLQYQDLPTAVT
jgi:gluconolactonase